MTDLPSPHRHGPDGTALDQLASELVEALAQNHWEIRLPGHTVIWSPSLCWQFGFEAAKAPARWGDWLDRIHPEDQPSLAASLQRLLSGQANRIRAEVRMLDAAGQWRWIALSGTYMPPERGGIGRPGRVIGVARDVTAEKLAGSVLELERDLAASLSEVSSLCEAAAAIAESVECLEGIDACGVYLLDENATRFRLVDQRGLDPEAIAAVEAEPMHSVLDWLAGGNQFFTAQGGSYPADWSIPAGLEALATLPIRGKGRCVGLLCAGSRYAGQFSPAVRNALENIASLTGGAIARIQAEEELRTSEQRHRSVAEIVTTTAYSFRLDEARRPRLEWISGHFRQITGYSTEEIAEFADPWCLAIPADALVAEEHRRSVLDGQADARDFRLITKSGEIRWVRDYARPRLDAEGRVVGIIGAAQDITDRKELEEQYLNAVESERVRIGHDLHDSLGQLLSGSGHLCEGLAGRIESLDPDLAETARHLADQIRTASRQARALAHGLAPVPEGPAGLGRALQQLADQVGDRHGIDCRLHIQGDPLVEPERARVHLFRVAQEAVQNAVRHGQASRIDVFLSTEDDDVVLRVIDTGVPFDPESAGGDGLGLRSMHYRAQQIGATLEIRPLPDGAEVRVRYRQGPDPSENPTDPGAEAPGSV